MHNGVFPLAAQRVNSSHQETAFDFVIKVTDRAVDSQKKYELARDLEALQKNSQ